MDSAEEKLTALNPSIHIVKHETMLTSANAMEILKDYDIVADGTDNFPTRYLVNDACRSARQAQRLRVPSSDSRVRASVFATEQGPCYRCLYPEAASAGPGCQVARRAAFWGFSPDWSASFRPRK